MNLHNLDFYLPHCCKIKAHELLNITTTNAKSGDVSSIVEITIIYNDIWNIKGYEGIYQCNKNAVLLT